MLPFEDRYSRQRRLPEVGREGQLRISEARLSITPHEGVELEREYLLRAGVRDVSVEATGSSVEFPWAQQFRFAAPRELARGAHAALCRLRSILGSPPGEE